MDALGVEEIAAQANSSEWWDKAWDREGSDTWRAKALSTIYERIAIQLPRGSRCMDLGGGIGMLARHLRENREVETVVCDHSYAALQQAEAEGFTTELHNFEADADEAPQDLLGDRDRESLYIVSTECMEHLTDRARRRLLVAAAMCKGAFISVPNDRLGPDVEPQHTIQFTAMSFKRLLQEFWAEKVRIECHDGYLLAVCGEPAEKNFTLSVTMPVRDEAHDLARTLASFRGIADEMVIGIDARSVDKTRAIAEKYADVVFTLDTPQGPPPGHDKDADICPICLDKGEPSKCLEYRGEDGIHFAFARNQCIDRCTGEWIFMSEGHEHLEEGHSQLYRIKELIPEQARIGFVFRSGAGQQWGFPWLFQNHPDIRFTRHTHNALEYPPKTFAVNLPQIRTVHDRHHDRAVARSAQRRVQNRKGLMDDWLARQSDNSLFYLAQEWREYDPSRARQRLEEYLVISNNGPMRYQARLVLAKNYYQAKDVAQAKEILLGAMADDWSRVEHFLWLGDIAQDEGELEKAYQFYRYAATRVGREVPFTIFWIDIHTYTYLPAQRLAALCGEMGLLPEARMWAEKVVELLPSDTPDLVKDEAAENVVLVREAIANVAQAAC